MNESESLPTRVILAGLNLNSDSGFDSSMQELKALANACNMEVVGMYVQNASAVNNAYYVGSGKVTEIREGIALLEAEIVVFDEALSPMQLRNLTDILDITVMDRTLLILRIFADRARTGEAKLQVELARLQYMLPRLVGMHASLSRQGGASGSMSNKGTGEKKLELDRRHIEHRITQLKKNLADIEQNRIVLRKAREQSNIHKIALVGYTNAGKSTIMNWMVDTYGSNDDKKVLVRDMLFATLDTTVRKISPVSLPPFLLSDTVGFIDKLPHSLVKAFRSTLEEVLYADLILHVIDYSDENYDKHIKVTMDTLHELGASSIPVIRVYNKAECNMPLSLLPDVKHDKIFLSAKERVGLDELLGLISAYLYGQKQECDFRFPLSRGDILNMLFEKAVVSNYEYKEDGIYCHCICDKKEYFKFEQYIVKKD